MKTQCLSLNWKYKDPLTLLHALFPSGLKDLESWEINVELTSYTPVCSTSFRYLVQLPSLLLTTVPFNFLSL